MSKPVRIKFYISTGFAGCKHEYIEEIDRDEWEGMTEEEQNAWLDDAANTFLQNHIDYGAIVLDD